MTQSVLTGSSSTIRYDAVEINVRSKADGMGWPASSRARHRNEKNKIKNRVAQKKRSRQRSVEAVRQATKEWHYDPRWQLVAWHSGRTSVFGLQIFHVQRSICWWQVTIYVGKPSDRWTNQANSAFHPFGIDKWVVSCNWMSATSVRGGAIWWTLTKERQALCNLHVKLCDPRQSVWDYA